MTAVVHAWSSAATHPTHRTTQGPQLGYRSTARRRPCPQCQRQRQSRAPRPRSRGRQATRKEHFSFKLTVLRPDPICDALGDASWPSCTRRRVVTAMSSCNDTSNTCAIRPASRGDDAFKRSCNGDAAKAAARSPRWGDSSVASGTCTIKQSCNGKYSVNPRRQLIGRGRQRSFYAGDRARCP